MDHHDDNFDECFIGEFSVGEMNSAAKEILKRQDEAKRTVFVHMIKKSVLLLVAVILLIFLLMNLMNPLHTSPYSCVPVKPDLRLF